MVNSKQAFNNGGQPATHYPSGVLDPRYKEVREVRLGLGFLSTEVGKENKSKRNESPRESDEKTKHDKTKRRRDEGTKGRRDEGTKV